jgi:hypothetical protein
MKTYFKDLRKHHKRSASENVEVLFENISVGKWRIAGYLKAEFLLVKGVDKKGKVLIKKFRYEGVRGELVSDVREWLERHFVAPAETK